MTEQKTIPTFKEDWRPHASERFLQPSPLERLTPQESLVTIIIPTHNYGHLISETIDSVLQQTYKNLEIIVVDDGSADNTENVIVTYPQIKYIYQEHKGNHTPARAANHGLRLSHGEFVICLGADDRLLPTYVEKCLDIMLQSPNLGIVFTGTQEFGASDKFRFPRKLRHKYSILRHPHGQLGAMMVRRSVYFPIDSFSKAANYHDMIDLLMLPDPAGLYDEGLHSLDDWDFAIRATLKGWKVKAIPELLHQARVHQGRVTGHVNESELYAKYPVYEGLHSSQSSFRCLRFANNQTQVFCQAIL
jgi:glycosyltransferase involved in cell wall biosynthesis